MQYSSSSQQGHKNKLVVVFGATGQQGAPICQELLKDGYKIRAVVRNVNSPDAQTLKQLGCEIVHADLQKPETIDTVMKGADIVFGVTMPQYAGIKMSGKWSEKSSPPACIRQVTNIVIALRNFFALPISLYLLLLS
jgi:NAD(P)-dependent dehydrogenase (short-subunit alcohol dehydrogenase family)